MLNPIFLRLFLYKQSDLNDIYVLFYAYEKKNFC